MDLFEVISEEEFVAETSVPPDDSSQQLATLDKSLGGTKVYCDFCKGYYYAEYHYGREEDEPSG